MRRPPPDLIYTLLDKTSRRSQSSDSASASCGAHPIVSSREWRGRPIGPLGRLAKAREASRQLLLQRGRSLAQRSSFGPLAQADDWVGSLLLADLQDGLPRRLAGLKGRVIQGLLRAPSGHHEIAEHREFPDGHALASQQKAGQPNVCSPRVATYPRFGPNTQEYGGFWPSVP